MPIYPFECQKCSCAFDVIASHHDYAKGGFSCECGSTLLKRIYTPVMFDAGPPADYDNPLEQRFWQRNKRYIERNKDKFDSGEWELQKHGKQMSRYEPDFLNKRA